MKRLFVLTVWLSLTALAVAARDSAIPIAPDAEVQARIDRVVRVVMYKPTGQPEIAAAIQKEVTDTATKRPEDFVRQVLYYHCLWANKDSDRAFHATSLLDYLRISRSTIVNAVLPYLDTTHHTLANAIEDLLRRIEYAAPIDAPLDAPADYSEYRVLIRMHRDNPPAPLIRRMYRKSANSALLAMSQAYTPWKDDARHKEILWAEHEVADTLWKQRHGFLDKKAAEPEAAAQIEKTASDKEWWVRLYAAEIMRQHPAFRKPELLQRLAKDENALVRESADAALNPARPKLPPDKPPSSYPSSKASKK